MSLQINTKYNGPGVYAIIDIYNFKAYIGSSSDVLRRAKSHKSALKVGKHPIPELQKDYDNKNHFDFIVLEKCNCNERKRLLKEYCYMYDMMSQDFILYNRYGNDEEQLKNIILRNTLIVNCEEFVLYKLMKRYKNYNGEKISALYHRRTKPAADQQEKTTE